MPKGIPQPLNKEQEKYIAKHYVSTPIKTMTAIIDSTPHQIKKYMHTNNLIVPPEVVQARKEASRFGKGSIPFNKGVSRENYLSPEAITKQKLTQFAKGHQPHNTHENGDGAIVSRKDKNGCNYYYIRVKLGKWLLYHRVVWEQAHGKIPDHHVVSFKDGDTTNVCLDNLELITRTENMFRNSIHNYPSEVIPSLVLCAELENKINQLKNAKQPK